MTIIIIITGTADGTVFPFTNENCSTMPTVAEGEKKLISKAPLFYRKQAECDTTAAYMLRVSSACQLAFDKWLHVNV